MIQIRFADEFRDWLAALRDRQARSKILLRIERMELGNLGDVKAVGEGVSEARIPYGPGFRLYFVRRGETVIVLLCGGDKSTQPKDIKLALKLAKGY